VKEKPMPWTLAIMVLSVLVSGMYPYDTLTWILEVAPIVFGLPLVVYFGRQGNLSRILLIGIAVHAIVLAIGGHYTYAKVPLGDWCVQWGWAERNNYDKVGHFFQGFIPAMILGEMFLRKNIMLNLPVIRPLVIVLACGGISAIYEIIEWQTAVILGAGADDFLGTQGYVWDTQSDMLFACIGALVAVTCIFPLQRRMILPSTP
jgi:putative membrane protein